MRTLLAMFLIVALGGCASFVETLEDIREVSDKARRYSEKADEVVERFAEAADNWDSDASGDLSSSEIMLGLLGLLGVGGSAAAGRSAFVAHRRVDATKAEMRTGG